MAEILSHIDHAPTDAEKTQLRQLASDANLSEQKRTLATAIMHFHHKAADEDKAKLHAIAQDRSATEAARELANIIANMSHHPSAADKEKLKKLAQYFSTHRSTHLRTAAPCGGFLLAQSHPHPVLERIVRIDDDARAVGQARHDLRHQSIALPYVQDAPPRLAVLHNERRPSLAVTEQGAGRHLQHRVCLPPHETRLDAITVTEAAPRRGIGGEIGTTSTRCSSTPGAEIL